MKRILVAYAFASLAALPAGLVGDELLWQIGGVWLPQSVAVMLTWFAAAGLPSVIWAHGNLSRALGVKPLAVPELRIVGQRDIPVFGDVARLVGRAPTMIIPVAESLEFRYGAVVISEPEMLDFLRGGWRRQMRGEAPLARNYWCGSRRMDRSEYEARVALLCACNLVQGQRRAGSRNRLRWPPLHTMQELKWRYVS